MKLILHVLCIFLIGTLSVYSSIIPTNTATHTAVQNGSWFSASTWDSGTIPSDAAIVVIPNGITVNYEGGSSAHIFAIRVEGEFECTQTNAAQTTSLTFDTFWAGHMSYVKFHANQATDGTIEVHFAPFDIEAHKAGTSGYAQVWNANALAHYSDGATTYQVTKTTNAESRYSTYEDAVADNVQVTETSRSTIDDGIGILGRHGWDPEQYSIGMMCMGQIEIIGQEKLNMAKLAADANKSQKNIELETVPTGWKSGDQIVITRGGNYGATSNGEDQVEINTINGTTLTSKTNLLKNHHGRAADNLHCYVGNLTRNITFSSSDISDVYHRGHFMAMHNDTNVQIKNAAFVDMGRTDKSRLTDDYIWNSWAEPKTFKSFISALGQECSLTVKNPADEITNSRGRYSIHIHKTGAQYNANMAQVTGNVVWGNPGWGITHHDSHANVSQNVVYDIVGSGIVSEAGSESGFWDENLVVKVVKGHDADPYVAALTYEDYLYSGEGLGMKGRAVICRGNVIANAVRGVGVMNMNPGIVNQERMDAKVLAERPDYEVDNFPLDINGYSIEGDGVMPQEVALIMENTTIIGSQRGIHSIERDMGVNHESRSVFDGFICWGVNWGAYIVYQADYTFKDVFISGKNENSIGCYMLKHAHNHTYENIKLVDMGYGIQVSKLVGTGSGPFKTRNNGFTPWVFIDLTTENVTQLYKIEKEDPTATATYDEHGDNTIYLSSSEITERPTTFTVLDSTALEVDYNTNDFRFEVDGVITDDYGSYDMGIKQAWAQGTLRKDYPQRIYEFASAAKFEEYLSNEGVYEDTETQELYFILNEQLPNRRNFEYTNFKVRVPIKNAPTTGVYANPLTESEADLAPQLQMVSRTAGVTQSSTDMTLSFEDEDIDASPEKAIDGNNNGRINVQYFQQGLVPVGSLSSTTTEVEPWYDLDLGALKRIDYIDVWNTVELNGVAMETVSPHFKNFYVLISDVPFGDTSLAVSRSTADYEYLKDGTANRKFSLNELGVLGRYVRIQAIGTTKLAFSEIEILGKIPSDDDLSNEEPTLATIKVYPNPNNGQLFAVIPEVKGAVDVEIVDVMGKRVFAKSYEGKERIAIEFNGRPGIYYVRISTENGKQKVVPIIKQ